MSTHTPGPWHVGPITKAEARLLDAAPDLLAALKDAARWIDTLPEDIRLGSIMPDKLRAAIQKAEGNG